MKNLRQIIAPLIFNQSSHLFETAFTTRDEVEEFTRLLGMKISPSGKITYALFSPLICLNDDPSDPKNYFRSRRLFMVSAYCFYFWNCSFIQTLCYSERPWFCIRTECHQWRD